MSRIRANKITNQAANGAPIVEHGLVVSGILSATSVACLLYTSPSPRDRNVSRMPSSA